MAFNDSTDLIPLLGDDGPDFDIAMRGYDRRQVDEYVARVEANLAEAQRGRDNALAISADRAAQLANREAHIESLTRQAATATENIKPVNVSDRIRDMLQLATDEAAQIRRAAEEETERVLAVARADSEKVRREAAAEQQRLTASATQRCAEADQKLAQARTQAATELEQARAEATRITDDAAAERTRLDATAQKLREQADRISAELRTTAEEDFEITLRTRRTANENEARVGQQQASALATKLVSDAQAEVGRLKAQQVEMHSALRELHARLGTVIGAATGKAQ